MILIQKSVTHVPGLMCNLCIRSYTGHEPAEFVRGRCPHLPQIVIANPPLAGVAISALVADMDCRVVRLFSQVLRPPWRTCDLTAIEQCRPRAPFDFAQGDLVEASAF